VSGGEIYLTQKGFDKLMQELDYLKTTRRQEISRAIATARAHGDISENAEYDAAKDAQGLNEKKVAELEDKMSRARILDDQSITKDEVLIGAIVDLQDLDSEEKLQYTLVSELEADYAASKISVTSPVGKALIGLKVNEIVEIKVPAGVLRYKVIKIDR
jgi:transcription elongation factor GreA